MRTVPLLVAVVFYVVIFFFGVFAPGLGLPGFSRWLTWGLLAVFIVFVRVFRLT